MSVLAENKSTNTCVRVGKKLISPLLAIVVTNYGDLVQNDTIYMDVGLYNPM